MKTALTSLWITVSALFATATASAQYDVSGIMNDLQAGQQYYMNMCGQHYLNAQNQLQNMMQQTEANLQAANRQVVENYRQQTHDYQTPDAVVLERAIADYQARNPQACEDARQWQNIQNRQHEINMNAINQAGVNRQMMADTFSSINDMNMRSWRNNNAVSDHSQRQIINGIYERGDYYNPLTGEMSTLGWNTPNEFQTMNGNSYYTDGNSSQYQWDGSGWQPLSEIK